MESYDIIANQPVVIDNGSGVIKAGFAGDQIPKYCFANYVGRPKHMRVMAGALEGDLFIGPKAEEHRGLLAIRYPMEHGVVRDWNDMERIWQYVYSKDQLQTFSEEVRQPAPPPCSRFTRLALSLLHFFLRACYLSINPQKDEALETEKVQYTLPDGSTLDVGPARFRAPELLFQPDLIGDESEGLHEVLAFAIHKSDMDLRRTLFANIVLSGGSTLFKGFGDRLLSEVKKLAPKDVKIKISAPQERVYSTWIGGSILASLDTFKKMWVSKKEYEEDGSRAVHRKTF
ncbi:hypothetical protein MC885_019488 [Smutsia gigantea]|nr:hypothetical protein MC885_019488 [Smutsia gigantea]